MKKYDLNPRAYQKSGNINDDSILFRYPSAYVVDFQQGEGL